MLWRVVASTQCVVWTGAAKGNGADVESGRAHCLDHKVTLATAACAECTPQHAVTETGSDVPHPHRFMGVPSGFRRPLKSTLRLS